MSPLKIAVFVCLLAAVLAVGVSCKHARPPENPSVHWLVIPTNGEAVRAEPSTPAEPSAPQPAAPPCKLQSIYFDFDQAIIRDDQRQAVEDLAVCAKRLSRNVAIIGHCDERGTDEYNLALGLRRAFSVERALRAYGVREVRSQTAGKSLPVCTESTEACWQRNRRAESASE